MDENRCAYCGVSLEVYDATECEECGARLCSVCYRTCDECSSPMCLNCEEITKCGESVHGKCLEEHELACDDCKESED